MSKSAARATLVIAIIASIFTCSTWAQNVGECVRLKATSDLGIPLHPESDNNAVSARLANAAIAKVDAIDANNGWLQISADSHTGWIIHRYIDAVVPCSPVPANPPASAASTYVIGCWNLEHFHPTSKRGFPENTRGGPTYDPRKPADFEAIAAIIEALELKILLLSEIGAEDIDADDDGTSISPRSDGLDRLVAILGTNNFDYVVGRSGRKQRLAILFDTRAVRLNSVCECDFPRIEIEDASLFDRQPLLAHFTFRQRQSSFNDILVVAVHLASGQDRAANHDAAMTMLVDHVDQQRTEGRCVPSNERDVLIAGDFNANRFDPPLEQFWDALEADGWDVLADDPAFYPPTRLSGVPLGLVKSCIDYIIVSDGPRGLKGQEVTDDRATVNVQLIGASADKFREHASDHLPVTIRVRVMADDD